MSSGHCCQNQVQYIYVVTCYLTLAEGDDFTLLRNDVTFDNGASDGNTINLLINVLDDLLVEGRECFTLSGGIGSPAPAGSSFVGDDAEVCIEDDDCKCVHGSYHLRSIILLFC